MTLTAGIEQFAASLRGQLVQPGEAYYEESRKVFNGMIDKRPRFIARCGDVADVIACVNFAREEGLPLSIRGGGHNVAGFATNDAGLVIDLSRMKGIDVDPKGRTVRAQGGVTWGDLDHATHAFGLHAPGGVISTTGIAGLSLGGGIGHLTRKAGLSCDNLVWADVVTAGGELVKASAQENADLHWALRGGGGNFGVVTSFEFSLHAVSDVFAGPVFWSLDMAGEAIRFWQGHIAEAPDDLNAFFAFLIVPPGPPFPEHLHNKTVCGVVICYTGPMEKAEEVTRPLREFGPPIMDGVGPMPFPAVQSMFDPLLLPGMQNYWKADFFPELGSEAIEAHLKFGPQISTVNSAMHLYPVNGAAGRLGRNDSAWSYRDAHHSAVIAAIYHDPADTDKQVKWVRDYWNALHPYSAGGAYVNFMMEEGEDRVAASYRDNYQRLAEIKRKYDPRNLFRLNQNIKPA